jgi:hypothetical protein
MTRKNHANALDAITQRLADMGYERHERLPEGEQSELESELLGNPDIVACAERCLLENSSIEPLTKLISTRLTDTHPTITWYQTADIAVQILRKLGLR